MSNSNANLRNAKLVKNDEFYTQLADIETEMKHYRDFFKGKVVYCNCNDTDESNFFKYFSSNFEALGLKRLITTGYNPEGHGKVFIYEGAENGTAVKDLEGDGDFRSEECVEFLKGSDVVVTNCPFSLFREYVGQLMEYRKKFIIIGNMNAVTYKEIFPYVKKNELFCGVNEKNGSRKGNCLFFTTGDGNTKDVPSWWFTNIENRRSMTPLDLYKRYSPEEYPKYDNYDAVEVSKSRDVPVDYEGVMGVPVSFLMFHCPEQFEIVGIFNNYNPGKACAGLGHIYGDAVKVPSRKTPVRGPVVNGCAKFIRILIRRKI